MTENQKYRSEAEGNFGTKRDYVYLYIIDEEKRSMGTLLRVLQVPN